MSRDFILNLLVFSKNDSKSNVFHSDLLRVVPAGSLSHEIDGVQVKRLNACNTLFTYIQLYTDQTEIHIYRHINKYTPNIIIIY